jgi:AAA+ ATPase superfamily predicted ATPase
LKFIDRERELKSLEKFWQEKEAQLIVIYGKRRIGKTELIKHFIKNRSHIYFLAQKINEHENLKLLGEAIGGFFDDDFLAQRGFDNWRMCFEYLKKHLQKRVVLVIDEFSYLAEANKGISSIFQAGWDEYLKDSNIFLILCGSSISMMEEEVLSHKAPLYGRRTGQVFLQPFVFSDARKFYPGFSFEKSLELYTITGGNPTYLKRFNPSLSLENNIKENVLLPEAFLYNEVEFILREELREPRNYWSILKAIATSNNKISEIVNETALEKGILHKYLFILEDLQIIQKEVPITEKNPLKSRKGIYKLQDEFFKFWFKYILPNKGHIEEGKINFVLDRIKRDFNLSVAESYEKVAKKIIRDYEDKIFPFAKIGRWWDRNEEIDIVVLDEAEDKILFGEVKWSNKALGVNIYEDLKRKAKKVEWNKEKRKEYFCLFSKGGFTPDVKRLARKERIILFHKDKMVNVAASNF